MILCGLEPEIFYLTERAKMVFRFGFVMFAEAESTTGTGGRGVKNRNTEKAKTKFRKYLFKYISG